MRYTITVVDPRREPPAIDVLYCGSQWSDARHAVDRARRRHRGLRLRVVKARDDGAVDEIRETPIA
jgi:hypothetical protein